MKPGRWILTLLFVLAFLPARAVEPSEMLADPALEQRAEALGAELRCLVCQNESIEESGADLAHDLRVLLRQRLTAGDSDAQAVAFIVARYGDYVLLRPPFEVSTLALWLGPPALLLAGFGLILLVMRRKSAPEISVPLQEIERQRLDALIGGEQS